MWCSFIRVKAFVQNLYKLTVLYTNWMVPYLNKIVPLLNKGHAFVITMQWFFSKHPSYKLACIRILLLPDGEKRVAFKTEVWFLLLSLLDSSRIVCLHPYEVWSALFFPEYNVALRLISQLKVFASNVYLLSILLYISFVYHQLQIEAILLVLSYTIWIKLLSRYYLSCLTCHSCLFC